MRERVYNFLKGAGEPLPSSRILLELLHIQTTVSPAADKIMARIVGNDPRFVLSCGLWHVKETSGVSHWADDIAVLCMEDIDQRKHLRGAICCGSGFQLEFANCTDDAESVRTLITKGVAVLERRLLLAWSNKDVQLWKSILAMNGIADRDREYIPLRAVAARLLNRTAGRVGIDDVASMLRVPAPADCGPGIVARFMYECFPILLDRVPPEHRGDIRILKDWISSGRKKVDFDRFGFGPGFLTQLPESPGAYVMKDRSGRVIYVGQSRNLKRRIRSYFASTALSLTKIRKIHERLYTIDIRPAKNDVEALILEMRLIRKLKPEINLQIQIHARRQPHKCKNLVLLIRTDSPGMAIIYLVSEGRFIGKQTVRLHRSPDSRLRTKIKAAYFAKKKFAKPRELWEIEIVSRWLSRNAGRLNWVDVDEAGTYRHVIDRLNDYLHDPDELNKKVYYR